RAPKARRSAAPISSMTVWRPCISRRARSRRRKASATPRPPATSSSSYAPTPARHPTSLEPPRPADLERSIAGADGRKAFDLYAYDDRYFVSAAYTMGLVGDAATYDQQQAFVGRAAYRLVAGDDANFAIGADTSYVFKPADSAAGANS